MARPSPATGALRPIQLQGLPPLGRSGAAISLPKGREEPVRGWRARGWSAAHPASRAPARWVGARVSGARTARARLHPLFRRAGSWARGLGAGRGRQSAPPGAGSAAGARRGLWGRRVPGPARPCLPPARPPCPASTTSSWRSPSGGCCAHCAGSPCASLCRFLPAATASATPACRSSSGAGRG